MSALALVLLLAAGAAAEHREHNPIYRQLVTTGVEVADGDCVEFPVPSLADGLDVDAQRAVIEALPGRHAPVDQLLRKSVVAPLVFRFRSIEAPGRKVPVHGVDVWFVAYGRLETLTRKDFLDEALRGGREEAGKEGSRFEFLSPERLRSRHIAAPAANDKKERYFHSVFSLLDRVELSVTGHTYTGRTKESLLAATIVDRRFTLDPQYPNAWRRLVRAAGGKLEAGPPSPYEGAGSYVKITQLAEPPGALLVEQHVVFVEPTAWFGGANLLRSKLPMMIQSEVRKFRRRLAKQP